MNCATRFLLFGQALFLLACVGNSKSSIDDVEKVKKILLEKQSNKVEPNIEMHTKQAGKPLVDFIIDGHSQLDTISGDLNNDEFTDYVLVLKSKKEEENKEREEINRPLLLLTGVGNNKYVLASRNDTVVYCQECGGFFGDPYNGVKVRNGCFSVQLYGGSNWRWTRIITFKFNSKEKNWYLYKDGEESYHTSNPYKTKSVIKTMDDFGKISFERFNCYF